MVLKNFHAIGNKKSAGTKLVCLDSFFNNPGVYEIDMGTPMKKIFNEIGGGYKEPVKAFQDWWSIRWCCSIE